METFDFRFSIFYSVLNVSFLLLRFKGRGGLMVEIFDVRFRCNMPNLSFTFLFLRFKVKGRGGDGL